MDTLRLIKRKDIDLQKWDDLVNRSEGSLPYSLSWYLDAVSENWDGLVMNDYEAVMPLIWLRKFGVKCLYQPYYCQQTGIFYQKTAAKKLTGEFIRFAQRFPYININLTAVTEAVAGEFHLQKKINLVLGLGKEYKQLAEAYSENHHRNIRKADKNGWQLYEDTGIKPFQQFYLGNLNRKREFFKKKHEAIFRCLTNELVERNKGKIFTVINKEERLMAASLIIFHQNRAINIVNCSSEEGKKAGAAHFLYNGIIKQYAGTDKVLDFEGSSVPSIARFYRGFGASEEIFFNYRKHVFQL